MDTGTTNTSRKGFLGRASVAIAAAFTFVGSVNAESKPKLTAAADGNSSGLLRVRPAKRAVVRESVDLV